MYKRHIANLTSAVATPDETSVVLYLTTRFAHGVTGVHSYHVGDLLNVEVGIVVERGMDGN